MIQGLTYCENVLTEEQEHALLQQLDEKAEWVPITNSPNSRRVQHYGFRYDYRSGLVTSPTTAIPSEWFELFPFILAQGMNQVIVNEYEPGQGISAHTDSCAYDDTILCYTLGGGATMRFTKDNKVTDLYVAPRSVYCMKDEARYRWKHEMVARKSDLIDGKRVKRDRRISITFRTVTVNKKI